MNIRNFNKEKDLNYILSTFEDMFSSNPDFKPNKFGLEKFKEEILSLDKAKSNTIILENQIGYLTYSIREGKSGKKKFIIGKLYVNKNERKKGYAKKLIEKAKQIAKEGRCDQVELNSFESNLELYQNLGFKTVAYWMQMKLEK